METAHSFSTLTVSSAYYLTQFCQHFGHQKEEDTSDMVRSMHLLKKSGDNSLNVNTGTLKYEIKSLQTETENQLL